MHGVGSWDHADEAIHAVCGIASSLVRREACGEGQGLLQMQSQAKIVRDFGL